MVRRRELLAATAESIAVAVAGCLRTASGSRGGDAEPLIVVTDGATEIEAVAYGQVESVGEVDDDSQLHAGPVVPITLTDDGVASLRTAIADLGGYDSPERIELRLVADGETVNSVGLSPGLAERLDADEWDGEFVAVTDTRGEAETIHDTLQR